MIRISEHFYSLQGEGKTMGIPAVFIRLQSCNLMCGGYGTQKDGELHNGATWRCDTIEVWVKGDRYTYEEAAQMIVDNYGEALVKGAHLVWTGGEPLMQQEAISEVMSHLQELGVSPYVEVETNGTITPTEEFDGWVDLFNVSPKLANSGMPYEKRIKRETLDYFERHPHSIFKFVITTEENWQEVLDLNLDRDMIYLMPSASNIEELKETQKIVSEIAIRETIKFNTRLQIELWNKTTGV